MAKVKILLWFIGIYSLEWVYLIWYRIQTPEELKTVHYPFPFNPQGITWQTHTDYICKKLELIAFCALAFIHFKEMRLTLGIFLGLFIGYLIDYFLVYNDPYGWFYFIPLSYGLYMGICMCILTIREIFIHANSL